MGTVWDTDSTALGERLAYLLALSRPRFWLYLAGPVLVGVAYGASAVGDLLTPVTVALFAYFLVPANVYLYGVNDVFDRDVDAENPKKESGPEVRYGGQRWVLGAVVVAGALALPLFALAPAGAWPWLLAFLGLGAAYSAPPRLKTTPPLDSIANGLYVTPGAAAYVAVDGTQPPILAVVGGWLWAMGMHTFSAIPDLEPDRAAGIRTTATVLAERATYAYCAACWLLAAAAFAAIDGRLGAALSVYPLLVGAVAFSDVSVDRAYWWFPAINTAVGASLTMGALWVIVGG